MATIPYNVTEDPPEVGVYACRVPYEDNSTLLKDIFLIWMDGRWAYPLSDQFYRGEVLGWIGPLQRRLNLENRNGK